MSPWVKLSDTFDDDHRIAAIGASGAGLLVMLLAYSNRTLSDGWISENTLRSKSAIVPDADTVVDLMKRTGLLRPLERDGLAGFQIADDFVSEQPTAKQVKAERAAWRKRTAKLRGAMKKQRKSGLRAI
jgi:hypothetical protein